MSTNQTAKSIAADNAAAKVYKAEAAHEVAAAAVAPVPLLGTNEEAAAWTSATEAARAAEAEALAAWRAAAAEWVVARDAALDEDHGYLPPTR